MGAEAAVGLIKGKNPNTIENWSQVLFGPARFAMGTAVAGGAIKGALREAVETGTKTGLAGKVANFLDLNKLSLPKHKLADVTVKPLEELMTAPERALARLADTLNRDDELRARNKYFNLKPTAQLKKEAEIIDAADQVLTRDPADYVGERAKDIAAEVRKEVDKRGRMQQYMTDVGELHDLEDHAALQGGVLPLHLLPVGPEQRAKALADPDYHRQLTGEVLNDLRNDTYPEGELKLMEKKYGPLNVAQAKASWKIQQDLDEKMGRRIPAYTQDPKTGKLTPINLTGDEVTDGVQRALNNMQRGEYDPTQTAQVTTKIPPKPPSWRISRDAQASMDAGRGGMDEGMVRNIVDTATARIAQRHPKVMGLVNNYQLNSFSIGNHGAWDPETGTMDITLSAVEEAKKKALKSGNIEDAYDDIEGLLEHELLHTAQTHLGLTDYINMRPVGNETQADIMGITEPSAYARGELFLENQKRVREGQPRMDLAERKAFRQAHRQEFFKSRVEPLTTRIGPEGPERLEQLKQGILPTVEPVPYSDMVGRPAGPLAVTRVPHLKDVKPEMLDRLEKSLETVPNEKLNALSAEMRRNREADRATRQTRRVDPAMADEELDTILKTSRWMRHDWAVRPRNWPRKGRRSEASSPTWPSETRGPHC
jgi:hypothetical protein